MACGDSFVDRTGELVCVRARGGDIDEGAENGRHAVPRVTDDVARWNVCEVA